MKKNKNKNKNKLNQKIFILIIILIFVIVGSITLTYGFYASKFDTKISPVNISSTVKNFSLDYSEGTPTINEPDILPGWSAKKTVTITNSNSSSATYSLVFKKLSNGFTSNDLVYSVSCKANNTDIKTIPETAVPASGTDLKIAEGIAIDGSATHTCDITFKFKETNSDQSTNKGKTFTATLGIA